jgi:hypothetical protein
MSIKNEAKQRIMDFKMDGSKKKPKHYIHTAVSKKGTIEGVICKKCGTPIKTLIPDEHYKTTEKRGDKTIIRERLVLTESSNYTEIDILLDDGSHHITHGCYECLKNLNTLDLEGLYIGDMEQQMAEEDVGLGTLNWTMWATRTPISYKIVRKNGAFIGV